MIDFVCGPLIWIALACAVLFGGLPGLLVTLAWLGAGMWFVSNSRSRGWIADGLFLVTWPIWLVVEA